MADEKDSDAPNGNSAPTSALNSEARARVSRLNDAISRAGGARAVAVKAGLLSGTLSRYMSGREMRADIIVKIADACNVSIDWLLTGIERPESKSVGHTSNNANFEGYDLIFLAFEIARRTLAVDKPGASLADIAYVAAQLLRMVEKDADAIGLLNRILASRTPGKTP